MCLLVTLPPHCAPSSPHLPPPSPHPLPPSPHHTPFQERYAESPGKKFLYGTHYSAPAFVLYYLVRAGQWGRVQGAESAVPVVTLCRARVGGVVAAYCDMLCCVVVLSLSVCVYVRMCVCVCLSLCVSVCLSVRLSVCLCMQPQSTCCAYRTAILTTRTECSTALQAHGTTC